MPRPPPQGGPHPGPPRRASATGKMRMESRHGVEAQPLFAEAGKSVFIPGKRFRINIVPIFLAVFVPWIYFTWLYNLFSFKFAYKHEDTIEYWAVGIVLGVTILVGSVAFYTRKDYSPNWLRFNTLQFLVAGYCGAHYGIENFEANMENFYDWETLKIYPAVDTTSQLGQNLMDAGTVYFADGTAIDSQSGWHYTSDQRRGGVHRYCVAPIGGPGPTGSYDFWAVGMDCCPAGSPDFRCPGGDGDSRSGLRMMSGKDRPLYKLAVKQACATFGYKADHPLFFNFVTDPMAKVHSWSAEGGRWYMQGVAFFFCGNTVAVAIAVFVFSYIGRV